MQSQDTEPRLRRQRVIKRRKPSFPERLSTDRSVVDDQPCSNTLPSDSTGSLDEQEVIEQRLLKNPDSTSSELGSVSGTLSPTELTKDAVFPPEPPCLQASVSLPSDTLSDTSGFSMSSLKGDALRLARKLGRSHSTLTLRNSMSSPPLCGTPFYNPHSDEMVDDKLRRLRHIRIGITLFNT